MSEPILPLRQWPAGIQQASVPANDNALRVEALSRQCLGVANDASGTDADGDVWLVGDTPTGAFATFDEHDIALYRDTSWYAWAPVDGLRLVVNNVRMVYVGGSTNEWQEDTSDGIPDAPSDGSTYGRKDGAWELVAGTGIVESIVAGTNVTVDSTDPANPIVSATGGGGGMTNPMTTAGDIIYGGSSGTPTRLAASTDGYVLTLASGIPSWAAASGGGGGLTNWTEAANSSAPNTTVPVVSFTANNAAANVDAAIVPKGTGAQLAQEPTGTTAGGNKRGQYAVDFQRQHGAAAASVASGDTSAIVNGSGNTASGQYSFVGNGLVCSASNVGAVVVGGASNTANADYSWIPGGRNAQTRAIIGAGARASGQFSAIGDAQSMCLVLRRATTNATATNLTTDGAAGGILNQLTLPNNSAYLVKGSIVAREAATGDSKTWDFTCHIKRGANAAATSVVAGGTPASIGGDAGASAWTATLLADTSSGCLRVEVTGEASKSIKWVCDIYSAAQVVG